MLVSGDSDGTICLWSVASGKELRTLTGHNHIVYSVAFSPDGKMLVSGSADKTVKLWDVASGKVLRTLAGHAGPVNSVSFSPDGKTLASGSLDNTIKLWDVASGKVQHTLAGLTNNVNSMTFNINSLAFSPDGKILASGSKIEPIRLWDVASGKVLRTLAGHTSNVYSMAFSPDGKTLASGDSDGTIKLWDVTGGEELRTLAGHTDMVESIAFSPDGKIIASGSWDKTIKLWNVASGEELRTLAGHTKTIESMAFSPDGKILASGSWDKTIKLWNVASGKELHTLTGHTDRVYSVAFSPDGKTLTSWSWDKTTKLWDVSSGKELRTLTGHTNTLPSVALSPDGKTLATSSLNNSIIKLSDVASGKELYILTGHTAYVNSVTFSPDGKVLASGSLDGTIKLWDVASGRLLATMMTLPQSEAEVSAQSKAILFSDKDISPPTEEWLAITPEGYFDCSANAAKYVLWNINNHLYPAERYWRKFRRPDLVQKALRGEKITAPVMTNEDVPPTVNFLSVRYDGQTNGASAGSPQFVTVTLQAQGKHDFSNDAVQLLVNGRPLPPDSTKPLAVDDVSVRNTLPDPHVSEKDPIIFIDKGSIIFSDKTTTRTASASPYTFAKRFTFRVPLPLGDANVQSKGFQNVLLDAMVFDKDDLGSDHSVIWLQNKNAQQVKGNLIALCVGISSYKDGMNVANGKQPATGKIANLTYPDVDARAMATRLLREKGGLYDDVTVHTLCDGQVTLENLRKELTWLQQTARPGQIDTVMVFLSGHGVSSASGKYFFPAYNFDPQHPTETSLSGAELQQALGSKLRAQSVFLFVDSCHSGALGAFAGDRGAGNGDDLSFSVKDSGVYLLASSGALQSSLESNVWGHGAFTEALIDALKDTRVRNGIVHFDDLTYLVPDNIVKLLRAAKLNENSMSPVVPMEGRYLEEPVAKAQP
jgi:WD40 repeat protein